VILAIVSWANATRIMKAIHLFEKYKGILKIE